MEFDLTGRTIGPYQLQQLIGRGGMAWVYRATHTLMRWDVALKVLDPSLVNDADFVARFTREAQWLAQMQHPNIVRVLDAAWHDRYFYIAMEYLDGESLDRTLGRVQRLAPAQAVSIGYQAADALAYAHQTFRLIHRDMKPANLFLLRDGRSIKVLDFGVATMLGTRLVARTRIGTPEYMPREQYQGQADERSDVYSLGATLYHMVTGQLPALLSLETPTAPRRFNTQISPQLDSIILRALQREPEARFQSAAEMRDALRAEMSGTIAPVQVIAGPGSTLRQRPVSKGTVAGRPTQAQRGNNWLPWTLGVGGLILVLIFVLAVLTSSGGGLVIPDRISTSGNGNIPSGAVPASSHGGSISQPPTALPQSVVITVPPVVITAPPIIVTALPVVITVPPIVITNPSSQAQTLDVTPTTCLDASPYGLGVNQAQRIGCPAQDFVASRKVVIQQFARGVMVIFAKPGDVFDNQGGGSIYALANDGRAWRIIDTYIESSTNPADWYACQTNSQDGPEVTGVPWRGFGRAWCQHAEVRAALGRAVSAEQGDITASFQSYERGRAFQVSDWRGFPGWNIRRVYRVYLDSVENDFASGVWEQQ